MDQGTCPVCQMTFDKHTPDQTHCSMDCWLGAGNPMPFHLTNKPQIFNAVTCPTCGRVFHPNTAGHTHCSFHCWMIKQDPALVPAHVQTFYDMLTDEVRRIPSSIRQ